MHQCARHRAITSSRDHSVTVPRPLATRPLVPLPAVPCVPNHIGAKNARFSSVTHTSQKRTSFFILHAFSSCILDFWTLAGVNSW
jgi:hypothetical protein